MLASAELSALQQKVMNQKALIPSLYGDVDFTITPDRFAALVTDEAVLAKKQGERRKQILSDKERVERFRAYTMQGDSVSDAYAALMPEYGFRKLIDLLKQACDDGIESIDNPPQQLVDFISEMQKIPGWLDMDLVETGARITRVQMAVHVPFVIRGVFISTFTNKYSGFPMALTGALSGRASARRMQETSSFFTTASLPGALQRFGVGFKAAAMVRLMHSMVRFNLLTRSAKWNVAEYGIPIPQIDQMPAGMVPALLAAGRAIRRKDKMFTRSERAVVEFCRFQCYLLGLPEELLPDTPSEIINVITTYFATLRYGYDDETCGELARATIAAYRPSDRSIRSRVYNSFERSFSQVYFDKIMPTSSDKPMAKLMGIEPKPLDYIKFLMVGIYLSPQIVGHLSAIKLPVANKLADRILVRKINRLLRSYGHAEYTTDASQYADEQLQTKPKHKNKHQVA
ncbi:MAG: DUF2236 domain-containing protein [Pseudomonadales bacterium]|nr:DUF2236 domain-containing protein [Pseudomonadales bacterium]